MNNKNANLEKMLLLIKNLNLASNQYYSTGTSPLSDAKWDEGYNELLSLEKKTGIILANSPTQKVGSTPLLQFETHTHISKLWSMDKINSQEEISAWLIRLQKLIPNLFSSLRYLIEYKLDGLTLNVTYNNGNLIQAATRGNGLKGEAILPQAKTIQNLPLTIPYKGLLEVQGECIMRLSTFNKYNQHAQEPLKNARNAAAGALRNLDPAVTASRKLDVFFYQIGTIENPPYQDAEGMLNFLRDNGFPLNEYHTFATTQEEIEDAISSIYDKREQLDYLIDGVVIKLCNFDARNLLGYTEKFPRWAMAYKFPAEEDVTTLNNVTWEIGRTGKLTPLAHLEPVDIGGVTIARATLNNMNDITRKKVAINANVWVRRSNDVIPEIMGRVGEPDSNEIPIIPPIECPACHNKLETVGANLFCMNQHSCKPQAISKLVHFASRDAMDIRGFSEKTALQLYEQLGISLPCMLYTLTLPQLLTLDGFKQKKAENLLLAIEKSKHCKLDAFINAIGIYTVGKKTAKDLANYFKTFDALINATQEELSSLDNIGDIVATNIIEYFAFEKNRKMIEDLFKNGLVLEEATLSTDGIFSNINFVITGSLPTLSRNEAEKQIISHGGNVQSSISKKTNYLLAGEKAGSKLTKANALGIQVLSEEDFFNLIAQ